MEQIVSAGIIDSYFKKLKENLSVDVAIVGGGPSGLVASYFLAKKGFKVSLYETKLAPGGGMWGGAMMFNEIMVQKDALFILDELGVDYQHYKDDNYTIDSVHATSSLIYRATKAGVKIFNCAFVEDVVFQNDKVSGLVINWAPVHREGMHVDPLVIMSKVVIDGTGHECDIARTVERKNNITLRTETGKVMGERSLSVDEAERTTVENTKEIYPGLYVSGMASNGVSGGYRMGPIFGGMLLSGKKVADLIEAKLGKAGDE
jgi:thiamine thiazole synthase